MKPSPQMETLTHNSKIQKVPKTKRFFKNILHRGPVLELALNIGRHSVGRDQEGIKTGISGSCYILRQMWEMPKVFVSDLGMECGKYTEA